MGRRYAECATSALRAAKERRDRLRRAKLCINGETHGKATHGCRCQHCYDVHRKVKPADATPIIRISQDEADEILRLADLNAAADASVPLRRTG